MCDVFTNSLCCVAKKARRLLFGLVVWLVRVACVGNPVVMYGVPLSTHCRRRFVPFLVQTRFLFFCYGRATRVCALFAAVLICMWSCCGGCTSVSGPTLAAATMVALGNIFAFFY
jgi:hypothetical protein